MIKTIIVSDNDKCDEISDAIDKSDIFENIGEIFLAKNTLEDPIRSLKKMLNKCDAVFVQTLKDTPFNFLELFIKKSKHILLFNFPKLNIEEISKLSKLAGEANVKIQVYQKNRYNSVLKDNSKLITTPILIEVFRDFNSTNEASDDLPVTQKITDDLDNVLYLIRSNVNKVSATGIAFTGDYPDIVNIRLEFENGSVACLSINNFGDKNNYKYLFYLKGKTIKADLAHRKSQIHSFDFHGFDKLKEITHNGLEFHQESFYPDEIKSFSKYIKKDFTYGVTLDDLFYKYCIAERIMEKINRKFNLMD